MERLTPFILITGACLVTSGFGMFLGEEVADPGDSGEIVAISLEFRDAAVDNVARLGLIVNAGDDFVNAGGISEFSLSVFSVSAVAVNLRVLIVKLNLAVIL